nr:hypothetical protein [Nanoarchaeum sp.]
MNKIILTLLLALCINFVNGATLQGNIYDFELDSISDVLITVDSTPKQSMVSTDSMYSFELTPGTYTLTAQQLVGNITIASTTEQIEIEQEGTFRLDLILFPELEDAPEDINLNDLDETNNLKYYILIGFNLILIVLLILFFKKKKSKKEIILEKDEADIVLDFIKKNNNRTTQKDIRKSLAMSEAKLSLIITELEHKNLIEKIKKGRSNVIILKK